GPAADVSRPSRGIVGAAGVRRAAPSVVRVVGTACGLGVEGSGWVAAQNIVVTNAHVVAGETDTTVQLGGHGLGMRAYAIDFDPHDDIAILRVQGLSERPLKMASSARSGTSAAILGYPLEGGFVARPGRVGQTETVRTEDAYGHGPVTRPIVSLRGVVKPGNSGGPMVDAAGK